MPDTLLFMGGSSPEREVSLMSGEMVLSALQHQQVEVVAFDPHVEELSALFNMPVNRAFNILHGGAGENGQLSAMLNLMNIAVTGSGVLGSALAMDKHRTKLLWQAQGIPTAKWQLVTSLVSAQNILAELSLPLFVKPANGGSSTHASMVLCESALMPAIDKAKTEDESVLVEEFIEGREYTAAILDNQALPLIYIQSNGEFYDYHAKYIAEDTQFVCPCGLSPTDETLLQQQALNAFLALGCSHWGRVDFILTDTGPVFLEVNTVPGMTSHSLVPMAANAVGISYEQLVYQILKGAT